MPLTAEQIVEALGLPPVRRLPPGTEVCAYDQAPIIGIAAIYDGTVPCVAIHDDDHADHEELEANIIHEALHLVLGKASFDDEGDGMMAVEWTVAQELDRKTYRCWRNYFRHFAMMWTEDDEEFANMEIGSTDDFLQSLEWLDVVLAAIRHGWLTEDGKMVWGMGPHPSLSEVHRITTTSW